jgi:hypothetical protein
MKVPQRQQGDAYAHIGEYRRQRGKTGLGVKGYDGEGEPAVVAAFSQIRI